MNPENRALESPASVDLDEDAHDLYENAPCGYLSTLGNGLIVNANTTFLRWAGFARTEVVGAKFFVDLLSAGGRIFYETHFQPLLQMQGFVQEIALDVVCSDGRRLPVLVNARQRASHAAAPGVTRITVFDASDRRRYERELVLARNKAEEAAQARSHLIAMISHDVRTPLSAMLMATALLEKADPSPRQLPFIRVLRSSATHALTIVTSALDLSRLDAGRVVLREREFDFRELVEEVVSAARVGGQHKSHLTVNATLDDALPATVMGDRSKIGQILTNLLTNSVKFTERGFVSILVSVREVTSDTVTLEVTVSDTGIGIPSDRLPHIFDEFTQASDDIADTYGGTGLGLAITQKLLRLCGSALSVTSTIGQGSTFSFLVELKRAASTVNEVVER